MKWKITKGKPIIATLSAIRKFSMAPFTEFMVPKDGRATAYVCTNFVCKLPTTDVSQMLANLQVKSD
jgi:uncharacterized protein YyaL (SSP411 family)